MGAYRKDDGLYSKAEANICLTCTLKRCRGNCERLKLERERLHREGLPAPLYELDEEYDIPDEPPWPKKNPYITKEAHADDQGAAAKLPKD